MNNGIKSEDISYTVKAEDCGNDMYTVYFDELNNGEFLVSVDGELQEGDIFMVKDDANNAYESKIAELNGTDRKHLKGLIVGIYEGKSFGNCSNGGISSRCTQVVLIGDGLPELTEASYEMPAVKIIRRILGGEEYIHAEPVELHRTNSCGYMAGGSFISTSDSRFNAISRYPISLHDRQETFR